MRAQLTDESEFAMEGPFEREEKDEIERLCDEERERDLRDAEASDEEERQGKRHDIRNLPIGSPNGGSPSRRNRGTILRGISSSRI